MDGNASCLGLPDGSVFAVADVVSTTNVVKRRGRNVLLSRETTKARKASTTLGVLFGLVFWMVWFRGSIMINPRPSKIIHDHPRSNDQAPWRSTGSHLWRCLWLKSAPGETGEMTTRIKGQRIGFPKRNNSSKKPWGGSTERLPSLFWALLAKAKPHARLPVAVVRPRKRHSGPFGSPDPDSNKKPVFDHCPCGPTCHCWLWSSR